MYIFEVVTPRSAFSLTTTDLPMYDEMIANPEYFKKNKGLRSQIYTTMPPSKYIDKCVKGSGVSREELLSNRDPEKIKKYAEQMQSGTKFPLPMVDYSHGFTQEGLHRAFAAELAGLQTMPYLEVNKA